VNRFFRGLLNAALEYLTLQKSCLRVKKKLNAALFKVLLPDDINDPTGRTITFSKKAGI
jgi:hypothetical protein